MADRKATITTNTEKERRIERKESSFWDHARVQKADTIEGELNRLFNREKQEEEEEEKK